MVLSLKRGLTIADFEILTVGMIIDFLSTYAEMEEEIEEQVETGPIKKATQADFNRW